MRYPESYLAPQSQPWARSVEERLTALERSDALVAQESGNTFRQLNSSIDLLSSQVSDIQTSVSKLALLGNSTAQTTGGISRITNGTTANLAALPRLGINLDRPARVLVTGSMVFSADAGNPTSNIDLRGLAGWRTNYDSLIICQNVATHQVVPSTNFSILRVNMSTSSSTVISVPAGLLEIYPIQGEVQITGGGGSNMIVQISPITLSAIVLPD